MVEVLVGHARRRAVRRDPDRRSTFCRAATSRPAISTSCATSSRTSGWSRRSCPISRARSTDTSRTISSPTTIGGISVEEIATMGSLRLDHRRSARRCAAPRRRWRSEDRTFRSGCSTGSPGSRAAMRLDRMFLSEISGRPVPLKLRRQRSQFVDAMLDGHFLHRRQAARDRCGARSAVMRRQLADRDGRARHRRGDDDTHHRARAVADETC